MVYLSVPGYKYCIPISYIILFCTCISYLVIVVTISFMEDTALREINMYESPKLNNRMLKSVTESGVKSRKFKTQAERNPLIAFSEDDLKTAELDMISRKNELLKECNKLNQHGNSVLEKKSMQKALNNILFDSKHNISWCPIYKAASSIWMEHFAKLAGLFGPTEKYLLQKGVLHIGKLAKETYKRQKTSSYAKHLMISSSSNIIVVRHPFERLLSAFRDKLEKKENFYMRKFGYHIIAKYRPKDSTNYSTIPMFNEFLEYIVKEQHFDEHWRPYHVECSPCAIKYDYILKIETFDRDEMYVAKKLNIENIIKPKIYHESIKLNNNNINPNGHTDKEISKHYFKEVSLDLLEAMYDIYEKDFLLFGYKPDEYFDMTKR